MSPRDGSPTRSAIIAAAGALLEEGGPDAVTLRSVGTAAGVSRSAAYRHFVDKADLLGAIALQTLLDLAASIRAIDVQGPSDSRLLVGCRGYLGYAGSQPHHYMLIFGDSPIAAPNPQMEAAADDGMAALVELVAQAQDDGDISDGPVRELATVLWATLHGLAQLRITGHLHEPRTLDGGAGMDRLLKVALDALR